MKNKPVERSFVHRRVVGKQRLAYDVEIDGMHYAIRLKGRLIKEGSGGPLSEDCDRVATLQQLAMNDIENLAAMVDD